MRRPRAGRHPGDAGHPVEVVARERPVGDVDRQGGAPVGDDAARLAQVVEGVDDAAVAHDAHRPAELVADEDVAALRAGRVVGDVADRGRAGLPGPGVDLDELVGGLVGHEHRPAARREAEVAHRAGHVHRATHGEGAGVQEDEPVGAADAHGEQAARGVEDDALGE